MKFYNTIVFLVLILSLDKAMASDRVSTPDFVTASIYDTESPLSDFEARALADVIARSRTMSDVEKRCMLKELNRSYLGTNQAVKNRITLQMSRFAPLTEADDSISISIIRDASSVSLSPRSFSPTSSSPAVTVGAVGTAGTSSSPVSRVGAISATLKRMALE